jgi:hypothetical protein
MICLLDGRMKTVKLYDFNKLILFINERLNLDFSESHLNHDPLYINPWLSGFIDADGSFSINRGPRFDLVQAKTDHNNLSKKDIKLKLANYLQVSLSLISKSNGTSKKQYRVTTHNLASNKILISYLNKYPLFSSKFLNFKDFEYIYNLHLNKEHLTIKNKELIVSISKNKNNQRSIFIWDHLKYFYNMYN